LRRYHLKVVRLLISPPAHIDGLQLNSLGNNSRDQSKFQQKKPCGFSLLSFIFFEKITNLQKLAKLGFVFRFFWAFRQFSRTLSEWESRSAASCWFWCAVGACSQRGNVLRRGGETVISFREIFNFFFIFSTERSDECNFAFPQIHWCVLWHRMRWSHSVGWRKFPSFLHTSWCFDWENEQTFSMCAKGFFFVLTCAPCGAFSVGYVARTRDCCDILAVFGCGVEVFLG